MVQAYCSNWQSWMLAVSIGCQTSDISTVYGKFGTPKVGGWLLLQPCAVTNRTLIFFLFFLEIIPEIDHESGGRKNSGLTGIGVPVSSWKTLCRINSRMGSRSLGLSHDGRSDLIAAVRNWNRFRLNDLDIFGWIFGESPQKMPSKVVCASLHLKNMKKSWGVFKT